MGDHEPIGRCDFSDDELPLALEMNSLAFHTTPGDRTADERRYQRLNDVGFTVAVIWEDDLWSRPSAAVDTVHEGRRLAGAKRAVVLHSPSCPRPDAAVLGTSICA